MISLFLHIAQVKVFQHNQRLKERKNMCKITVEQRKLGGCELRINRGAYISSAMVENEDLDALIQALQTYKAALPKPCVHAELIKQYAEDCQKWEKPWELWEMKWPSDNSWNPCKTHPVWASNGEYRRKQDLSEVQI